MKYKRYVTVMALAALLLTGCQQTQTTTPEHDSSTNITATKQDSNTRTLTEPQTSAPDTTPLTNIVRCDQIRQFHLAVLNRLHRVHLSMEITHVVHLLCQLLHTHGGQLVVINHRRLAHLMRIARQTLLRFRRRIGRSRVVDMQLQFPKD